MKTLTLNGILKHVPTGFSWTTLFFGPFPALFRGDIKWAAIQLIAHVLVALITLGFGVIVTWIAFAGIYNGRYEQDLKVAGWSEVTAPSSS